MCRRGRGKEASCRAGRSGVGLGSSGISKKIVGAGRNRVGEPGPVGWQGKWEGTRGYFGRNRSQCTMYILLCITYITSAVSSNNVVQYPKRRANPSLVVRSRKYRLDGVAIDRPRHRRRNIHWP